MDDAIIAIRPVMVRNHVVLELVPYTIIYDVEVFVFIYVLNLVIVDYDVLIVAASQPGVPQQEAGVAPSQKGQGLAPVHQRFQDGHREYLPKLPDGRLV